MSKIQDSDKVTSKILQYYGFEFECNDYGQDGDEYCYWAKEGFTLSDCDEFANVGLLKSAYHEETGEYLTIPLESEQAEYDKITEKLEALRNQPLSIYASESDLKAFKIQYTNAILELNKGLWENPEPYESVFLNKATKYQRGFYIGLFRHALVQIEKQLKLYETPVPCKVFIITGLYGSEISILGVFTERKLAHEYIRNKKLTDVQVDTYTLNQED